MAAITTSDVAYQSVDAAISGPGRHRRRVQVTFPTVNLDYSTGGVPLVPAMLGSARGVVRSIAVIARTPSATASMNPAWQWDGSTTSPKLVGYREAAAVADGTAFDQLAAATPLTANSQILILDVEPG